MDERIRCLTHEDFIFTIKTPDLLNAGQKHVLVLLLLSVIGDTQGNRHLLSSMDGSLGVSCLCVCPVWMRLKSGSGFGAQSQSVSPRIASYDSKSAKLSLSAI